MRPILTPAEMGAADRRAIAGGTRESVLVERAGTAVARHALHMLGATYGRRVVVVCGKGNNGADGNVAAGVLARRGIGVDVFALADGITEHALRRSLQRADLAIDAMFGTGFRGVLDGDAALVAFSMRALPTLAVDIPSGVDGLTGETRGPAVSATETITFAALKPGLVFEPGRTHAGIVHEADIGIAPGETSLHLLEASDCWLPHRAENSHKWTAGALIIGGSTGMIGAPLMASHAAARSGAGMVVCALPGAEAAARASTGALVARGLPATSGGALDAEAAGVVLKDVDRFHAVAIGPGLGRDERTQAAVREIVAECPTPIIVDADALNALAVDFSPLRARHAAGLPPAILTPHAGEYARLAGAPLGSDRVGAARELAARTHAIVLLKGPGTVIASPAGTAVVNPTDIPALAAAGTGDVLTGIITGICANGAPPAVAAATGAFVHGLAAREAGTGDELVATDLIPALHPTFTTLRAETNTLSRVSGYRPVWAEIDLDAVRANVRAFAAAVAPASVCAVVKAEGYGHGAVEVGRAALEAGAGSLAVALVEEGAQLRDAGIDAPIFVLSEPVADAADSVVVHRLTPVVYTTGGIDALAKAAVTAGLREPLPVHLKVDTGMHRVGCAPEAAVDLASHVVERPELVLAGVCTHFAVADEPGNDYTEQQRQKFETVLAALRSEGLPTGTVHACNSAGALTAPNARYDLVRVGIGVYGIPPAPALADAIALRPALALKAHVSHVQPLAAGERVSYGLRWRAAHDTRVATVPAGYADGVPRELSLRGGEVLIRGQRFPIAGTVTMDQLMVDVGAAPVEVGDEVVLLGRQGDVEITAQEWADHMDTIGYTIVCGIGPRVPRRYA